MNPFRGHEGVADTLTALPDEMRRTPLVQNIQRIADVQAPDLYPYGYGLSFTADSEIEIKVYTTRYDQRRSPLRPGSALERLISTMGVPPGEMQQIQRLHDRLWESSGTKAIQVSAGVSERKAAPDRLALLYCGPDLGVTKSVVHDLGFPPETAATIDAFSARMKTDRAMYLGFGVTPAGLGKRVKLYDAAFFRDMDTSALKAASTQRTGSPVGGA